MVRCYAKTLVTKSQKNPQVKEFFFINVHTCLKEIKMQIFSYEIAFYQIAKSRFTNSPIFNFQFSIFNFQFKILFYFLSPLESVFNDGHGLAWVRLSFYVYNSFQPKVTPLQK